MYTDASRADEYDYPTEPIAPPVLDATDAEPSTQSPSSTNWATVLASAGAAAVVAALILSIGVVGFSMAGRNAAPVAAPATVVQLGQAIPAPSAPAAASSAAPSADPDAPAAPAAPPIPAEAPAAAASSSVPEPASSTPARPANLGANFTVTAVRPTLTDLGNIVKFLVETQASDEAKAANVEGGMAAVVVPRTVYSLGLFRAPLGWNKVTGPLVQQGSSVTATLNSGSAGRPTIRMTIEFKKIDGNWRLAASSLCQGVKAVGLNIYCNR